MNVAALVCRLSLLSLAACVRMAPVAPEVRASDVRAVSVVQVDSACGSRTPRNGSGVIISQRHVLTAANIVGCTKLPRVHVTYIDDFGEQRRMRMYVTDEDRDANVAKLEIASAERFRLHIPPPIIREPDPGNRVCADLGTNSRPAACGTVASTWTVVKRMRTTAGDVGAPVYCEHGTLVGIVVARGESSQFPYTWIAPIDASWLDGIVPAGLDPRVEEVLARARHDQQLEPEAPARLVMMGATGESLSDKPLLQPQ